MTAPIRLGDSSSHGGSVTSVTATQSNVMGKSLACVGDPRSWPNPGHSNCKIVEGNPNWVINGKADEAKTKLKNAVSASGAAAISQQPQRFVKGRKSRRMKKRNGSIVKFRRRLAIRKNQAQAGTMPAKTSLRLL